MDRRWEAGIGIAHGIAWTGRTMARSYRRYRHRRTMQRLLEEMPDERLRDIGLTRAQLAARARRG